MRSFLLKEKKPILKWGQIPDGYFFEGTVPEGYSLAICPHFPYVILDVDKHGNVNGFDNISFEIFKELDKHFNYLTKNNGRHYWMKYTGNKHLLNKSSGKGIDLRTDKVYVKWYLPQDIRAYIHEVKDTSENMNNWLENLFIRKLKLNILLLSMIDKKYQEK